MVRIIKKSRFILIFIFFSFLLSRLLSGYQEFPLHIDEHEYIRKSIYFDLVKKGDFKNPLWQHFDAYDEPKLVVFFYGLSLHLAGIKDIKTYLDKIDFNDSWQWGGVFWRPVDRR